MQGFNDAISVCRHCRFYTPEGRRGGQCARLGVPVCSQWSACSLAQSPFIVARKISAATIVISGPWQRSNQIVAHPSLRCSAVVKVGQQG